MRLNRYIALATGLSRRAADVAIEDGRVLVNNEAARQGVDIGENDVVKVDGKRLTIAPQLTTLMLNKPVGYICSRDGQGDRTIYDLLPIEFHDLKSVGRLDKDSSGLILMTNDGNLAHELTHPSFQKTKIYEVTLSQKITEEDRKTISETGVMLDDGVSKFNVTPQENDLYIVNMQEGRNRQIRRTFAALGYDVTYLNRTHLGNYALGNLKQGQFQLVNS